MKKILPKLLVAGTLSSCALIAFSNKVFEKISKVNNNTLRMYDDFNGSRMKGLYMQSRDDVRLYGTLIKASEDSRLCVMLIHGIGDRSIYQAEKIAKYYHDKGVHVFLTDQRGYGLSKGEYTTYGSRESLDHMMWIDSLKKELGHDVRIILHGISMGAATTLLMCERKLPRNVKGVILDSSFSTVNGMIKNTFVRKHRPEKFYYFLYKMACFNKNAYDPERTNPIEGAKKLNLPVIFAHTIDDSIVPCEMTEEMYDVCPSINKRLVLVPGDNHSFCFELSEEMRMLVDTMIDKLRYH